MNYLDYAVVAVYFVVVIGIGFWYRRRASRGLDSYFLAGKSMHWLALAMSGSVATFDITGTMWIVALLYLFGMKSMWNHWMWGFLMAAFFMAYMGKWVRRSRVMTGAEWMVTRFGDGPDGRAARMSYTLMAVVTLAGFVGYAFQGIGRFAAVYVSFERLAERTADAAPWIANLASLCARHELEVCAVAVFTITTLYVLLGGLYSVVVTNVIQTVILTVASILIAVVAYVHLSPAELAVATPADGTSMTSLLPQWRLQNADQLLPSVYQGYELFGALVLVWVVKGLLLNLGGPGQMTDFQLFLSTRNPRDAAKVGAAWSGFLIVRWAMCMGIALLAITKGLDIVTADGQVDAEAVMPKVLETYLTPGLLGLVIAGLLAAFMSTFSATVNAGASYIVRDLYQPLVRPQASERHLVRASYVATIGLVVVGTTIGYTAGSIRQVWDWLMMALGAAFVIPNVLRWYWWRLNGWGYAVGTLIGLIGALLLPISLTVVTHLAGPIEKGQPVPAVVTFFQDLNLPYVAFPLVCGASLAGCLIATWLTRPTGPGILRGFYRTVRPFGVWGPVRRQSGLDARQLAAPGEGALLSAVNVVLASVAVLGAYLAPMYLVGHWHLRAAACFSAAAVAVVALYFTWYKNLPPAEDPSVP